MMGWLNLLGAFAFGLVVGWVTYRTLRRSQTTGLSDIASVIGAIGGAAVTGLFAQETGAFGVYCLGLAIGFFGYVISAIKLAHNAGDAASVNEWLGEPPQAGGAGGHNVIPPPVVPPPVVPPPPPPAPPL
jgi:hypothetical protein